MGAAPRRRRAGPALLWLGMSLVALAGIELVGWVAYRLTTTPVQRQRVEAYMAGASALSHTQLTAPHPYSLFQPAPGLRARGFVQHNALGFRGPELRSDPGVRRIFALGGSTTWGWGVDNPHDAYPAWLGRMLASKDPRIEVVNAGLPMGSSAEALATLHFRVLPHDPALVILHAGLNDVFPILMPGYRPDYAHDRTAWRIDDSPLERLLYRSHLMRVMLLRLERREARFGVPYVVDEHWDWQRHAVSSLDEAREARRYVGFENNLRSFIAICREYAIPLVLSPTTLHPDFAADHPALRIAYGRIVEIMRGAAAPDRGVHFLDTSSLAIPRERFTDETCHLDARGQYLKARFFADFLEESGLLSALSAPGRRGSARPRTPGPRS